MPVRQDPLDAIVGNRYSSYRMEWVEGFNLCAGVYVRGRIRARKILAPIEGGS